MGWVVFMILLIAWPLSGVAGQRLAQKKGRDGDFWLFACSLGGPLAYFLLRGLGDGDGKVPRNRVADRIVAIVSVLFFLFLVSGTLLRACLRL